MRSKYVIAGIGHTKFGRLPGRGTVSINVEACRNDNEHGLALARFALV